MKKYVVSLLDREPSLRQEIELEATYENPLDAATQFGESVWDTLGRPLWFYVYVSCEGAGYLCLFAATPRSDGPYVTGSGYYEARDEKGALRHRADVEACAKLCAAVTGHEHVDTCPFEVADRAWKAKVDGHKAAGCRIDSEGFVPGHEPSCPFYVNVQEIHAP